MISIYDFIQTIENEIQKIFIEEGNSETGTILNYDIVNDNTIRLETGFSDYEEGDKTISIITFTENEIVVEITSEGHNVYCGDYDKNETLRYKSNSSLEQYYF